jgi:Spy/CpxP family protein refolding chaperone
MRQWMRLAAVAAFGLMMAAPGLQAKGGRGHEGNCMAMAEDNAESEGMGAGAPERWRDALELSKEQVAKLKEMGKSHLEAMKPLREAVRKDAKALKALVEKKAADADLTAAIDKLKQDREAMRAKAEEHRADMAKILSPTQQAKMVMGMAGKMGERAGKWMERKGKQMQGKDDKKEGKTKP